MSLIGGNSVSLFICKILVVETGLYLLVIPLPSCLHESRIRVRSYIVSKSGRGPLGRKNPLYILPPIFWDREGPEGYPQSPKTFKALSPLPHYWIKYLIP